MDAEKDKNKKRELIKTIAIVFLAVMLVLTFFSNTIMNRTLPEVAIQYVGSGTIATRIRGTGTIKPAESYEVKLSESRKVKTVYAKVGNEVEAGDLLFVLSDEDSTELDTAKDALDTANYAYQEAVISASNATENLKIKRLREKIKECQEILDTYPEPEMTLTEANDAQDEAKTAYDNAKTEYTDAKAAYESAKNIDSLTRKKEVARSQLLALRLIYCQKNMGDKSLYASFCKSVNSTYMKDEKVKFVEDFSDFTDEQFINIIANQLYDQRFIALADTYATYTDTNINSWDYDYIDKSYYQERYKQYTAYNAVKTAYETYYEAVAAEKTAIEGNKIDQPTLDSLLAARDAAKETYEAAVETYNTIKKYEDAETNLKTSQENLEDEVATISASSATNNLNIEKAKAAVEKAQAKVDKLSATSGSSEVYADVSGKIESVAITPGSTTTPDTALCTIEVPDMGYNVEISVTSEQAQKVQIGTMADVSSGWWSTSDTQAKLVSIKSDPSNPKTNKLLVFNVTGSDISSGDSLSLSLGERDKNYDCVIPKSAIRSDSNGSFVLVVTSKSSPLGNRYFATRVDVTVAAQDDTNAAVTGALTSGDCVITTSSAPVSKGDQVRMADK